jgi:hypothetical protein
LIGFYKRKKYDWFFFFFIYALVHNLKSATECSKSKNLPDIEELHYFKIFLHFVTMLWCFCNRLLKRSADYRKDVLRKSLANWNFTLSSSNPLRIEGRIISVDKSPAYWQSLCFMTIIFFWIQIVLTNLLFALRIPDRMIKTSFWHL